MGSPATVLGFPTRWYRIEVAAPTTLTFNLDWPSTEDLGAYVITDPWTPPRSSALLTRAVRARNSETSGPVDLAPGTYFIGILNFSATNPPFFTLGIN